MTEFTNQDYFGYGFIFGMLFAALIWAFNDWVKK